MSRFIAVGEVPRITEAEFREALGAVKKWRFDRQSWVVKAYLSSENGKLVVECETPERARFEEWLKQTGWQLDAIYQVDLIHEGNYIWSV